MKHIIITILTLLSISLQAQIRMNTKQSFVDSTRLNATGDSLYYYQNGTLINSRGIVASSVSPSFQTLSLGEGYADVAKEYHIADGKTVYPSDLGYNYAELLQADVLSKTSLILTPTAIATGVVASQKPLSSDGDFTFTRSTSATRVNENGYIEKETQNLLLQSNTFDTTWVNVTTFETGGQSGYDGSNDAWLLTKTGSGGRIEQGTFNTGLYSFSVYVKSDNSNWVELYLDETTANDRRAFFDLQNGLVGTTSNNIDANIESIGNGWYRCSIVGNMTTTFIAMIFPAEADNDKSATSGSIYIQDAQLEQGLVARDYIETTTSAVYGGVTDNVPRIDYTDGEPSLLLEPSRTNDYISSNSLSTFTGNEVVNAAISPEGNNNATKLIKTSASDQFLSIFWTGATISPSTNYAISLFVKYNGYDVNVSYEQNSGLSWDLTWNALFQVSASGVTALSTFNCTSDVKEYANGWYRIIVYLTSGSSITATSPSNLLRVIGASGDEVLVFGGQQEQGSYATSYIPTYGTAVTRNAEQCDDAGSVNTFNDSEGVLYVEIGSLIDNNDGSKSISISSGGYSNNIIIQYTTNTNQIVFKTSPTYTTPIFQSYNVSDITQNSKIAFKYKLNDCSFWHNGVKLGSVTSFTPFSSGTLRQLNFDRGEGNEKFEGNVKQILYFPTALTDAELAELTKQ